ncbi:MAG: ABC transporter permease subunit [Opitutales bacterium]
MLNVIIRRLLATIPLLFGISLMVFLLMYLAPGDFLDKLQANPDVDKELILQLERQYGFVNAEGEPRAWYVQYLFWLNNLSPLKFASDEGVLWTDLRLGAPDLGYSFEYNIDVTALIGQRLPRTVVLSLTSLLFAWCIAIPLGVFSAIQKDKLFDRGASLGAYSFLSIPEFFTALLMVMFAANTGLFPMGGSSALDSEFMGPLERTWDYLHHLMLPTFVLGIASVAGMMRIMRGNYLDYLRADFATTARAKGLSENKVLFKHVLRNAINPLITSFGFAFSSLLSGALIVEQVFTYPGLGQLMFAAFQAEDQYVVMAGVMISVVMLILGNLLADLLLAWSDPRIRLESGGTPLSAKRMLIIGLVLIGIPGSVILAQELLPGWALDGLLIALEYSLYTIVGLIAVGCLGLVGYLVFNLGKRLGKPLLRRASGVISLAVLGVLYLSALFAQFLAPYLPNESNLTKTFHPPSALTWSDDGLAVQVYARDNAADPYYAPVKGASVPLRLFASGSEYTVAKLFGWEWTSTLRLFQLETDDPNARIYLMGSDSTGRCVFSRLLYGARVSMSVGLIGISITIVMAFLIGGLAGYFGGSVDFLAMRFVEFLMAVPGLYLLLSLRAALGSTFESDEMYVVIIIVLSVIGWAGWARVIRGMTLSIRGRQYVMAAESMGSKPLTNLTRHVLPNLSSYLLVAATLSIPGYVLGEAALSFLGLGIAEPNASWGLMLSQVQKDGKIFFLGYWWLFTPGLLIFITVICFNVLGDVLRDIVDPRMLNR